MTHRTRLVLDTTFGSPSEMVSWVRDLMDYIDTYGAASTKVLHEGVEAGFIDIEEDSP